MECKNCRKSECCEMCKMILFGDNKGEKSRKVYDAKSLITKYKGFIIVCNGGDLKEDGLYIVNDFQINNEEPLVVVDEVEIILERSYNK